MKEDNPGTLYGIDLSEIPMEYREDQTLIYSLAHFPKGPVEKIRSANHGPFYKVFDCLASCDMYNLTYDDLAKIEEYYELPIISYLMQGNRCEFYGIPVCKNRSELKRRLTAHNKYTHKKTLRDIIANMF